MTQEEIKMRDNIALVAMQCLLRRKQRCSLLERIVAWFKGYDYIEVPDEIASTAYEYAYAMMNERAKIIKEEKEA